jgi:hypothetical protein
MAMAAAMAPVAHLMPTASTSTSSPSASLRSRGRRCARSAASFAGQPLMAVGSLPVLGLVLSRPATAGVVCAATKEGKEQDTQEIAKQKAAVESPKTDVDTVTRKFGLEAGLWKVLLPRPRLLLPLLDNALGQFSFGITSLHSLV